jgi:DNA-binding MarR family transcriptional regulator
MSTTSAEARRNEVVHDLFDVLMRFNRSLRSVSGDWGHVTGSSLTKGDVVTLGVVQRGGSIRPSRIAAMLGVDPSVVSRHLATLHRLGLVTRGTDPRDGRAELISATAAGRDRLLAARDAMCAALADRLAAWDPETIARTAAAVEELAQLLHPETSTEDTPDPVEHPLVVHTKETHA